jgi:hypothetical protein
MFKTYLNGPVFAALGNNDSNPESIDSPHNLPGPLSQQQSRNYDHVASLWQHEGWIDKQTAEEERFHYGGYSIKNHLGVLTGWDGSNPLLNPTDLFYQIIDRYAPHVIANVFFGHTHEDQIMVCYANNGTDRSAGNALTTGWIGPSVTPLNNLNSGFWLYEVDTGDFNIYDAWTFYSPVNSFPNLTTTGPTFSLEYSTRDAYGPAANWSEDALLNATFWHSVTEAMERNRTLMCQNHRHYYVRSVSSIRQYIVDQG